MTDTTSVELLHLQERLGHAGDLLHCSFAQ
jgi:hypothetical protein